MDFSINKETFLTALNSLSKTTPNRTTLPVLSSILIKTEDTKTVSLRTTDLEIEMVYLLDASVLEEGEVCAPIYKLFEIAQNILDSEISIHVNEAYRMRIKNNTGKYLLSCSNTEEFPDKREDENNQNQISTEFLRETIKSTLYGCSKDELKPALNGVLFNFNKSNVTSVSTDGHRLIRFVCKQENQNQQSMIVPQKFLNILSIGTINLKKAELHYSENYLKIKTENQTISTRLISEKFPDYENVIPKDLKNTTTINTKEFLGAIKRVSLMSNKTTKQIILNIQQTKTVLSAEDHETGGSATEEILTTHKGEEITVGFNSNLLSEILKHQNTEEIELLTSGALHATLIKQKEETETETTTLLMPIRI